MAFQAPPPTPSNQKLGPSFDTDTLSSFLRNLPPSLSLPSRLRPSTSSKTLSNLPTIPLSSNPDLPKAILSASTDHGFFHLSHHNIPSQLAQSAELESKSLFQNYPEKSLLNPTTWPLGFDDEEQPQSFCFQTCSDDDSDGDFPYLKLKEFASALKKVGLEIVEALFGCEKEGVCSLMKVVCSDGGETDFPGSAGGNGVGFMYPYVVGLQYQMVWWKKCSLLGDSGWVFVAPEVDSILVTIGDIAQVWSDGKLKKVRGRAIPGVGENDYNSSCMTMSLLMTLPMDSSISSLSSLVPDDKNKYSDDGDGGGENDHGKNKYRTFSFEEYAWRVYHERLLFKDPLDKYRLA